MERTSRPLKRFRLVAGGLAALMLAVLLAGCGESGPDVAKRMEQARGHVDAGELREASIELKNVLQADPEHADARLLLGRVYVRMGLVEAAAKELGRAESLGKPAEAVAYWHARSLLEQGQADRVRNEFQVDESWPAEPQARLHAMRARAAIASGDLSAATAELDAAETSREGTLEAQLARIELALAEQRIERARRLAESATQAFPDAGRAWRELARVHMIESEFAEAEQALGEAIRTIYNPHNERLLRAQVRLTQGEREKAREDVEWLRQNAGDHPSVIFSEGLLALADGSMEEACTSFAEALSRAPEMRQAQYYTGVCQYRNGEYEQAAANLEDAYQGRSGPRVGQMLAATYIAQERYERAREVLRPLLQRDAEDVTALALMARVERASGNTSEMLEHLRRLAELRPDDPRVRLQLGFGLFQAGKAEAGQAALGEALEVAPDSPEAGAAVALSHIRQGQFDEAIAVAERLREQLPEAALPWTLEGLALLARGDREGGVQQLERALEKDAGDPGARHLLSRLALGEGDLEGARSHYEAVLESRPEHTATLVKLAALEGRAGNPDRMGELLERAHESNPEARGPRLLLARFSLARGELGKALELVQTPDGRVPGEPEALTTAALVRLEQGRPSVALRHLERLLEAQPDNPQTFVLLARTYSALGEGAKAREQLQKVLDLDEDNPVALLVEARSRIREGDLDEARSLLDRAPEAAHADPRYLDTRARLAIASGELDSALEHYRRAQEAAPSGDRAGRMAALHQRAGRAGDAESLLDEYIEAHPDDTDALQARGDLYTSQGRDQAAAEAYRAVLERDPAALEALNNLAWVLRKDDSEEALRYAEHAATLQPEDPRVIDTLGMVLLELERSDQAVEQLRKAVSLAPEAGLLRYHLAQALVASGEEDEALRHLDDALAGEPRFSGVEDARALRERLAGGG
jgi:putative PEP-CTERM system TPR-repeat lipoprotein